MWPNIFSKLVKKIKIKNLEIIFFPGKIWPVMDGVPGVSNPEERDSSVNGAGPSSGFPPMENATNPADPMARGYPNRTSNTQVNQRSASQTGELSSMYSYIKQEHENLWGSGSPIRLKGTPKFKRKLVRSRSAQQTGKLFKEELLEICQCYNIDIEVDSETGSMTIATLLRAILRQEARINADNRGSLALALALARLGGDILTLYPLPSEIYDTIAELMINYVADLSFNVATFANALCVLCAMPQYCNPQTIWEIFQKSLEYQEGPGDESTTNSDQLKEVISQCPTSIEDVIKGIVLTRFEFGEDKLSTFAAIMLLRYIENFLLGRQQTGLFNQVIMALFSPFSSKNSEGNPTWDSIAEPQSAVEKIYNAYVMALSNHAQVLQNLFAVALSSQPDFAPEVFRSIAFHFPDLIEDSLLSRAACVLAERVSSDQFDERASAMGRCIGYIPLESCSALAKAAGEYYVSKHYDRRTDQWYFFPPCIRLAMLNIALRLLEDAAEEDAAGVVEMSPDLWEWTMEAFPQLLKGYDPSDPLLASTIRCLDRFISALPARQLSEFYEQLSSKFGELLRELLIASEAEGLNPFDSIDLATAALGVLCALCERGADPQQVFDENGVCRALHTALDITLRLALEETDAPIRLLAMLPRCSEYILPKLRVDLINKIGEHCSKLNPQGNPRLMLEILHAALHLLVSIENIGELPPQTWTWTIEALPHLLTFSGDPKSRYSKFYPLVVPTLECFDRFISALPAGVISAIPQLRDLKGLFTAAIQQRPLPVDLVTAVFRALYTLSEKAPNADQSFVLQPLLFVANGLINPKDFDAFRHLLNSFLEYISPGYCVALVEEMRNYYNPEMQPLPYALAMLNTVLQLLRNAAGKAELPPDLWTWPLGPVADIALALCQSDQGELFPLAASTLECFDEFIPALPAETISATPQLQDLLPQFEVLFTVATQQRHLPANLVTAAFCALFALSEKAMGEKAAIEIFRKAILRDGLPWDTPATSAQNFSPLVVQVLDGSNADAPQSLAGILERFSAFVTNLPPGDYGCENFIDQVQALHICLTQLGENRLLTSEALRNVASGAINVLLSLYTQLMATNALQNQSLEIFNKVAAYANSEGRNYFSLRWDIMWRLAHGDEQRNFPPNPKLIWALAVTHMKYANPGRWGEIKGVINETISQGSIAIIGCATLPTATGAGWCDSCLRISINSLSVALGNLMNPLQTLVSDPQQLAVTAQKALGLKKSPEKRELEKLKEDLEIFVTQLQATAQTGPVIALQVIVDIVARAVVDTVELEVNLMLVAEMQQKTDPGIGKRAIDYGIDKHANFVTAYVGYGDEGKNTRGTVNELDWAIVSLGHSNPLIPKRREAQILRTWQNIYGQFPQWVEEFPVSSKRRIENEVTDDEVTDEDKQTYIIETWGRIYEEVPDFAQRVPSCKSELILPVDGAGVFGESHFFPKIELDNPGLLPKEDCVAGGLPQIQLAFTREALVILDDLKINGEHMMRGIIAGESQARSEMKAALAAGKLNDDIGTQPWSRKILPTTGSILDMFRSVSHELAVEQRRADAERAGRVVAEAKIALANYFLKQQNFSLGMAILNAKGQTIAEVVQNVIATGVDPAAVAAGAGNAMLFLRDQQGIDQGTLNTVAGEVVAALEGKIDQAALNDLKNRLWTDLRIAFPLPEGENDFLQ